MPLSVAGSVGRPVAELTPPLGESDTTTTTKPPEASSSRTQRETPLTMLQFSGVRGTAYDTSCGGAVSRPGGADTSVTQYWPGAGRSEDGEAVRRVDGRQNGGIVAGRFVDAVTIVGPELELAPPTIRSSAGSVVP